MSSISSESIKYAGVNGIRLAYETFGVPSAPAVVLIHGLATQMLAWPTSLCEGIAARDYYVIRFDNRDIGLSTTLDHLGVPSVAWLYVQAWVGRKPRVPYDLGDMSVDTFSLMDFLEIEVAHIVGASMGGMIAQHMAATSPSRVQTLTSIMSSSGAKDLPDAREDIQKLMASSPHADDGPAVINHSLAFWQAIASPAYPPDSSNLEAFVRECIARCAPGGGSETRHLAAVIADGSRVSLLQNIRIPTLVVHGDSDPLVPLACGIDTARHVANAKLKVIPGMGHDLPLQLVDFFVELLVEHFRDANGGHS